MKQSIRGNSNAFAVYSSNQIQNTLHKQDQQRECIVKWHMFCYAWLIFDLQSAEAGKFRTTNINLTYNHLWHYQKSDYFVVDCVLKLQNWVGIRSSFLWL